MNALNTQMSGALKKNLKRRPIVWGLIVVATCVVMIFAVWFGRGISVKTSGVEISVLPSSQIAPKSETFGDGSPIVSAKNGEAQAVVIRKSRSLQGDQKSDADIVTHGAGSPIVTGAGASASTVVTER